MHYVVTTTLPADFAGRTKALLKRTRVLNEQADIPCTIISTNYNPNYNEVYRSYVKKSYVSNEVNLVNIYDFLSNRSYKKIETDHQEDETGLMKYELKKNQIYRFFDNGKYVLYKNYETPNNQLKFVDIMDPQNRKRKFRKEYNRNGLCHKETVYKQGTTNVLEEIFYDEDGKAYLNKTYNGTAEKKLIRIYYFGPEDVIEFKNEKELIRYCFERMIEKNSTVICDARFLDRPLIEMTVTGTKKIFLLHNSHESGGEMKSSYRYILEHYEELDHLVVLTEHQKEDLRKLIGDEEKISVIPHSVQISDKKTANQKRSNCFVFVGRLAPEKQVDHLIEAFRLKQEQLKEVTLEIYGTGEEQEKLEQLIASYQLQDKVFLKGKTTEPEAVFARSKASFLTSQYEGFGLVIIESLNNGCPVVAYDVKYGPRDLITDGENGLLIQPDDIESLAEAMVKMTTMEFRNVKPADKFSDDRFLANWSSLVAGTAQRKAKPFRKLFKLR